MADLSQQDCDIIKQYPLNDSLDTLVDLLQEAEHIYNSRLMSYDGAVDRLDQLYQKRDFKTSQTDLAIKYQELSPDQRESIFISFVDQLRSKNQVEENREISNWVRKEGSRRYVFNGRQIRNIMSTALGIAISEGRKLLREGLASVASLTDDFKRDLYSQEVVFNDRQMVGRR